MKNQLSNLSMILIGFIGGIAFLISCGEDSTNDANAADVPDINDQMLIKRFYSRSNKYH